MDVYLTKTLTGLKPLDEESEEALKRFKIGETIKAKVSKPRNYKFHKKYYSLLKLVLENQDQYITIEELLIAIKLKLKMYDVRMSIDNKPFPVLHSISFAKMDELEFGKFYSKTLDILSCFIGVDSQDLENELINYY